MRVRFVGSGDAFGSGGRWQTCIMVESGGQTVLVDCGATSLVALKSQGLDPGVVDAVVITHIHADHVGGLPFLILDGQFSRRESPLRVVGPPGLSGHLTHLMEAMFAGSSQVARRFTVEVTDLVPGGGPVELGGLSVRGWPVIHECGLPPMAVRVADERSTFAYTGDTEWTPTLVEAARGANLFAAEAYMYDKQVRYHLDYQTLHEHLPEFEAERTVLTHMSASMLGRLNDVDLPAAYDGLVCDLSEPDHKLPG